MSAFDLLRAAAAATHTARNFPAPHRVVLPLDPSIPGDQQKIDDVSAWARSSDRSGRSRRTVRAASGEVEFEFEKAVDAVECVLRSD